MKSLCLIKKSIRKLRQFTEYEYHKYRLRKVPFLNMCYLCRYMASFHRPSHVYALVGCIICTAIYVALKIDWVVYNTTGFKNNFSSLVSVCCYEVLY